MSLFHNVTDFLRRYFWFIVAIIVIGYVCFGYDYNPISRPNMMRHEQLEHHYEEEMAMDMAMAEPAAFTSRMAKGLSMPVPPVMDGFDQDTQEQDRKIIKNAQLTLEVADTTESKTLVEAEVKNLEGSITHSNSWQVRHGVLGYRMTIRVPSANLENLLANLSKIGTKLGESFSTSDVTAHYQDLESRLENLRTREASLRELMDKKDDELGDLLQVDREISSVRQQIENLESQQKRTDSQSDFSTLHITLQPQTQIKELQDGEWNVKKSWATAVNGFQGSLQNLTDKIFHIIALAPIWVPILIVLWIVRRWFFTPKK